ncbi:uncharacterized protein LOC129908162 [Episyrphus balteatus]|uniref:uncharacterized protein LOC129908162 n=1 Tax=Episyrphus balteatus TaxID=286459 RepID=UPI002486AC31|nr:uncharacterized protein LOC129908162 [Episyrphus balteatus]
MSALKGRRKTIKPHPDAGCCVVGCVNHNFISENELFYYFPNPGVPHQRREWIAAVRKINGVDADGNRWTPNSDSIICCHHFDKKRKSTDPMKVNYVPTLFPPEAYKKEPERPIDSFFILVDDEEENQTASSVQQLFEKNPQNVSIYPYSSKTEVQQEFIDHVVIAYFNRCRSRAGRPNVGMPHYILKNKAEEAAVLLSTSIGSRYLWYERFEKVLAESDAKGIVLTPEPQSLVIADIMIDEWPKFVKERGLDINDESDNVSIISMDEIEDLETEEVITVIDDDNEDDDDDVEHQIQIPDNDVALNRLGSDTPALEENPEKETISQEEFLRHVLMTFVSRYNAAWPRAELPDYILSAKYKEAALILGSEIANKDVWVYTKQRSLENCNQPISVKNNKSLEMRDIIEELRQKFSIENDNLISQEDNRLEEVVPSEEINSTVIKSEPVNPENFDETQIQTCEEARDCLDLLKNYAIELGDSTAFILIREIDTVLKSNNCVD